MSQGPAVAITLALVGVSAAVGWYIYRRYLRRHFMLPGVSKTPVELKRSTVVGLGIGMGIGIGLPMLVLYALITRQATWLLVAVTVLVVLLVLSAFVFPLLRVALYFRDKKR